VSLSTLRVTIRERPPEPARTGPADRSSLVGAFLSSVEGLLAGGYALLLLLARLIPYLVVLGVLASVGTAANRRFDLGLPLVPGGDEDAADREETQGSERGR
jgi:hypothetical protein